ncbi:hypothetical protein BCR44DRAFT_1067688 [Catenaria anguillulae PL171]|uniref:Sphingomyelin synthase-like domain-containing protein n=1 Tax=Catenaria anguillulae PL171 TaxID=765915 RepID=A0A1Y2HS61_9FUNG|nr:hypothetical protein BCR44DRAFT_1067688 [Catenaria anguillulae PL171]
MHPPLSPPLRAPAGPPSATPSSGSGIAAQRQDRSHRPPLALALPLPPLPPVIGSGSACASDVDDHDHDHDHDHHVLLDASPHAPSLGHGHGRSDSGSCCNHLSTYTATRRRPEDHTTHAPPSSASSAASASISCASTTLLNRPPPPLPNPPLPVAFQSWFKHLRRSPLSTLSHTLSLWPLCRSRHDLALFALAWTYFSLCSYITCLANSTVDRYNPNNVVPIEQRTVLMDPGMQTLATAYATYVHGPRDVSDWFVRLCSVLMVTRAVLHRERAATVLRRACYVGGTLYLLRAQTVLMTVLPNPLLECESKPHANVWYDAYLLFTQQRASCGDVFFSGHSIIFMTNLNLWWVFGRNWAAKLAAMLTSIIAVISLLASSYHYSIDVWTACILCLTTFFLYQWTATGQIGHGTWWGP